MSILPHTVPLGDVKMNFARTRRVIVTGMIGNVLEWYDFAVYGFFAAAIGAKSSSPIRIG
jgi:MHS family proline/betaine transporter-like MFS transporter